MKQQHTSQKDPVFGLLKSSLITGKFTMVVYRYNSISSKILSKTERCLVDETKFTEVNTLILLFKSLQVKLSYYHTFCRRCQSFSYSSQGRVTCLFEDNDNRAAVYIAFK